MTIKWGHRLPVESTNSQESYEHPSIEEATQDYETRRNKQLNRRGFSTKIPTKQPDLPMLCHEYREPPTWDTYAIQPKIDGIRCIAKDGELFSRTNQLITSCPHIEMYLKYLPEEIKLDGELVIPNVDWTVTEGFVNRQVPSKESMCLEYHIFDIIDTEAPFWARSQEVERLVRLLENKYVEFRTKNPMVSNYKWFSLKFPFKVVPTTIYDEPLEDYVVQEHFKIYRDKGYEGLIVRNASKFYQPASRSSDILKLKQFFDKEYTIVDVIPNKKKEGVLVCEIPNGTTFNCNVQAPSAKKKQILEYKHRYIGKKVTVEFEGIHESGRPRNPVATKFHGLERPNFMPVSQYKKIQEEKYNEVFNKQQP